MLTPEPTEKIEPTLDDKYEEFLSNSRMPKSSLNNPLNLFDDSNKKDRIWLKIAKGYLSKAG